MSIRVVMVEDHVMVRRAMIALLEAHGFVVVGEGASAQEGLELLRLHKPDLAIIDIQLPDVSGCVLLENLRRENLNIPTLVISGNREPARVTEALNVGARGYISKFADVPELLQAARTVSSGGCYLSYDALAPSPTSTKNRPSLTQRQCQLLAILSRGKSNAEIAATMHLSVGTIKRELSILCRLFQCSDRTSLVASVMGNTSL